MLFSWTFSIPWQAIAALIVIGHVLVVLMLLGACKLSGDQDQYLEDNNGIRRS